MSEHETGARDSNTAPERKPSPIAVSRRTLVKTAAGASVAAAAATVGISGVAHGSSGEREESAANAANSDAADGHGPVVVYLNGHRTLEIFTDGVRSQVTDADLAGRIARAAQR
jgi:hypothetical protein